MTYLIRNLDTGELGGFAEARDAAYYLWGRDMSRFRVYKRGLAVEWLGGCVSAIVARLEGA